MTEARDVVILGSGPAGLTAALYAARANLRPLVVEGLEAGGQLTLTTMVENWPGFRDGIMGPQLMAEMRAQAERFGATIVAGHVTRVDLSKRPFVLQNDEREFTARALIVATGASARLLGLPSERVLMGHGVSTCATCDGFFFRNRAIAVVGGGDTAMEEAIYLTRFASTVTVIHRRDTLRASKVMQDKAFANPKILWMWNSAVERVLDEGKGEVTGVEVRNLVTGDLSVVAVEGLFVAIGHNPNTSLLAGQLDARRQWLHRHPWWNRDIGRGRLRLRRRARSRLSAGRDRRRDGLHGRPRRAALPRSLKNRDGSLFSDRDDSEKRLRRYCSTIDPAAADDLVAVVEDGGLAGRDGGLRRVEDETGSRPNRAPSASPVAAACL